MTLIRPLMLCPTALLAIAIAAAPESASAQKGRPKPPATPPAGHPGLPNAEKLLTQAKDSAKKDPLPEFGGHRAKAIKHIDHAHKHLQAAIKAASKGKGKDHPKGKDKAEKGKDKDKAGKDVAKAGKDVAKAVAEMDLALTSLRAALKAYDEHHKGKGRQTGLHHAEKLVQEAKAAASQGH